MVVSDQKDGIFAIPAYAIGLFYKPAGKRSDLNTLLLLFKSSIVY